MRESVRAKSWSKTRSRARVRPRAIPRIEALEGRRLLSYTFTPIIPPGVDATGAQAHDINGSGTIVGVYQASGTNHGFLKDGSGYITLDATALGAIETWGLGINDSDQVVGQYRDSAGRYHGFLKTGPDYTTVDATSLGAVRTTAVGINNAGEIVGLYYDPTDHIHAFIKNDNGYTELDLSPLGAPTPPIETEALGINDAGQIVGYYKTGPDMAHGFLRDGDGYHTLDADAFGATQTHLTGINDAGQIAGDYIGGNGRYHGLLIDGQGYHTIDATFLGAIDTRVYGINDIGQIVGEYADGFGQSFLGFLAIPDASVSSSSLSGLVFEDFNNDGQVDFGEPGISGVSITLTGMDDLGNPVNQTQQSDGDGAYVFLDLRPGNYTIAEGQPAGYSQGKNSVGTGGGTVFADQFDVHLAAGLDALNYNFGERPAATGTVEHGQTAGIGFWNNKNGQQLIKNLNGGTGHQLGDWLATTFPNTFGANSGTNDLTARDNAYVASFFQGRFVLKGVKLDAQLLATALAVYVTNESLNPTGVGAHYGFLVAGNGVGTAIYNIGSNGDAFGVADNSIMTVMDLLLAADVQAVNGVLYNGNTTRRTKANNVFGAINQAGGI